MPRKIPIFGKMRKCTLLLLAVIFYSCAFTQTTKSLTSEVSLDSLVKTVREFSGEDSATFNDTTVRIVHRVSKRGNNLAADYLVSRLKAYGLKVETIDYRTNGRNVVGTLIGKTNPDSVYFISAHYDAVADYCADDNASGSATVLEAARIMSKYCFNNTIKFAFWDEEELGLIGSRYYADSAIANNEPILGVLNMDMMGYDGDSNKVFDIHTNSNPENQRLKDTVLFMLDMLNIDLVPNVINPGTTRSDHAAFWKHRYPAVFCGESFIGGDPNPKYHTSKDRIDLFDLNYYHKLAQLAIGTIVELTDVIPTAIKHDTVSACYAYNYNDSTFLTSTVYVDSLKTTIGCDSLYNLHLTIRPTFKTTDSIQVCGKYAYRNKDFTISGIYHDTLVAQNGCDSIYTMHLTVYPILRVMDTIVVCERYTYRGNTYELSGFYRDTLSSQHGCDSIYTINLIVLPVYRVTDPIDVCGEYVYRGKAYQTSGVYHDTLTSRNGCDSFYTMDLTIREMSYKIDTVLSCGDYTYRSRAYTNSGIYHDTLIANNGCDSFYSFDLRLTRINDTIQRNGQGLESLDTASTYQWVRCRGESRIAMHNSTERTYRVLLDDFYAVMLNKNQCSDTSDCLLVRNGGVESMATPGFVIYPNPTTSHVHIDFAEDVYVVDIYVISATGQRISSQQLNKVQSAQIKLPEHEGVYFIHVITDKGSATKRILKLAR